MQLSSHFCSVRNASVPCSLLTAPASKVPSEASHSHLSLQDRPRLWAWQAMLCALGRGEETLLPGGLVHPASYCLVLFCLLEFSNREGALSAEG